MYYRYLKSHAYESVLNKDLMTSSIGGYNDPFEFVFSVRKDYSKEDAMVLLERRLEANPSLLPSKSFLLQSIEDNPNST